MIKNDNEETISLNKILRDMLVRNVYKDAGLTVVFDNDLVLHVEDGHLVPQRSGNIGDIVGTTVLCISREELGKIKFSMTDDKSFEIDISDDCYTGPEAAQLYHKSRPIIVIN